MPAQRVLVVDDEDMLVEYLMRALAGEGYEVDSAYDGAEAEEKALENNYDIVILDVVMPQKSGIEVCRDLRAQGIKSHILILSSKDDEQDKVLGLDAGADDYMTKPFGFYELSARLRALERRPKEGLIDELTLGNIKLNLAKQKMTIAGKPFDFRRRELELMHYLMSRPDYVVSREEMLEKVWGISASWASSNRVEACIAHLRKQLELTEANVSLAAKRGLGYHLVKN
jgi:DNA-binding response OmpR family regulator